MTRRQILLSLLGLFLAGTPLAAASETAWQQVRVLFGPGEASLDAEAESALTALAETLTANTSQRVVLQAHAAASDHGHSHARRLSLSRALAIRAFLAERGVATERVHPRPLGSTGGNDEDGAPADRVDILPLRP